MKTTRRWMVFLGLAMIFQTFPQDGPGAAEAQAASIAPARLRCEYLENPLGLDVAQPRLSWILQPRDPAARGQRQTAYQILVASTPELLDRGQGDLWDSGVVPSAQSAHIAYSGRPLASGAQCFWKVRVHDEAGRASAWSAPARWTMGLLAPDDWTAQWIGIDQVFTRQPGSPPPDNTVPDPWLRKSFQLDGAPRRAVVYVASVGYHELFVNGTRIGDAVLAPSATDHTKRARYVAYEIAEHLRPGRNTLGLWLGVSWSIFPPHKSEHRPQTPIVRAQAEIELADGAHLRIATDPTWKTHPSPNTLLGVWDFMHFGGERYDANREIPAWAAPEFDDSSWSPATVYTPQLAISAEKVEPNRVLKPIRAAAVATLPNGEYRVDMGVNFTGWTEIDLAGAPGSTIESEFSEDAEKPMTHRLRSAYVLGPSGKGTFRNRFNYSTGRWIQIKGLSAPPALEQVRGYLVRTDYAPATAFSCSDPLLNRIYDMTLWTFENLSLGAYVVDCPHRERMGYGGDAHATTQAALSNYHLGAFYTKWSEDWRDVQKPDGNLPYTAPTYWGGGGPAWSGYCVTLPWEVYRRYGDLRILEVNFPTIQRWLAFLETKAADDMLVRWGGEWDFLGDWVWPGAKGVNGDTPETLFFNNCYWIYNLQTAAAIAERLGKPQAASDYRARAETVRQAVHAKFFNPADASYANGWPAYLAIALVVDLPPEALRPAVWQRLEKEIMDARGGHIHAGITGGFFLIKCLLDGGRSDLIHVMATKEDYPSFGDMMRRGATTFWETWEGDLSLCHSSFLWIGTWFVEGLAGIQPDDAAPGFAHFFLKPAVLADRGLTSVQARHECMHGPIVSEWKVEGTRLTLTAGVPPNTTATLHLPAANAAAVRESGRPLAATPGARLVKQETDTVIIDLEPGLYRFESGL